ncbi:hypothetical protein BWK59_05580 [Flavobacterium davisii]|nr:hypothetical protein BWK59_05580 [Flavobacterium davisii]
MEDFKSELEILRAKEIELKKVFYKSFSSEDEFELFVEQNKNLISELKSIKSKIKEIEWHLKSDDEKKTHLKYLKDLKNKFKDENL